MKSPEYTRGGKPLLLDLFCCAGGAAMGYSRAGFDVLGVDINPQPNYPFAFEQADALDYLREEIALAPAYRVVAIHASPPCQAHTTMANRYRGKGGPTDDHLNLIPATRDLLRSSGLPYIIENVEGARRHMRETITLHGGMFGLGVHRPRLFESNVALAASLGARVQNPLGVYGKLDGRRIWSRADGTEQRAARTLEQASAAMGIDWMTWPEITEAIPPSYTEHLGRQLIAHLAQQAVA